MSDKKIQNEENSKSNVRNEKRWDRGPCTRIRTTYTQTLRSRKCIIRCRRFVCRAVSNCCITAADLRAVAAASNVVHRSRARRQVLIRTCYYIRGSHQSVSRRPRRRRRRASHPRPACRHGVEPCLKWGRLALTS